jgi:hypothetical protein
VAGGGAGDRKRAVSAVGRKGPEKIAPTRRNQLHRPSLQLRPSSDLQFSEIFN